MQKLTQKQETFCLKYFKIGNATEAALIAGYSARSIRNIASITLTKANVQARLTELRAKAESDTVATVLEREQILTDMSRVKGKYTMVKPNTSIQAIAELNKMTGVYTTSPNVNINNTVNIQENIINAGERLDDAINRLVARIGEGEVPGGTE